MFTEIDATEYLDDLWSRDGPHKHLHITKFEEVCLETIHNFQHFHKHTESTLFTHSLPLPKSVL